MSSHSNVPMSSRSNVPMISARSDTSIRSIPTRDFVTSSSFVGECNFNKQLKEQLEKEKLAGLTIDESAYHDAGYAFPRFERQKIRAQKNISNTLNNMTNSLSHRGPDDSGIWTDNESGIGLGHRRLSVLDLSSKGHQPMVSSSLRYVLVYNGEIYNHKELRKHIESHEGELPGIKEIMINIDQHPFVLGVLSDLFEVNEKYQPAIESALNGYSNYLIVEKKEDAFKLIQNSISNFTLEKIYIFFSSIIY